MIFLSVGMPRAGSAWHYNLVHDLMKTAGSIEAREIRSKYHLQDILTEVNCNIGVLSPRRLMRVLIPALLGKTFVIKAHAGPTPASRLLQRLGILRITYIYRDPRDAMLSAYEYGQRALLKGQPNAFSHLTDFRKSLDFIRDYVQIWKKWMDQPGVLVTRYEDLLTDYSIEAARLVSFLKLEEGRPEVWAVIKNYDPAASEGQQGLHFYKGKIGRYRQAYTEEEKAVLVQTLSPVLTRMGYAL